jgi:putative ABC transport system ATP-binding protein
MEIGIDFRDVKKRYGDDSHGVVVLDRISLSVRSGEFVALMGPSGSGKSTLLNLCAGLLTPTDGEIWVAGQNLAALDDDERSDLRLHRIGFVFQSFNLFPTFTAEENVLWPLEFMGVPRMEARQRAAAAIESVGLNGTLHARRPGELSGGEQQRIAIARALVNEPAVMLADEPTGNLDSHTASLILDLLSTLNRERGVTIVLATHDREAAAFGRRTIEVRDGRIERDSENSEALPKG